MPKSQVQIYRLHVLTNALGLPLISTENPQKLTICITLNRSVFKQAATFAYWIAMETTKHYCVVTDSFFKISITIRKNYARKNAPIIHGNRHRCFEEVVVWYFNTIFKSCGYCRGDSSIIPRKYILWVIKCANFVYLQKFLLSW